MRFTRTVLVSSLVLASIGAAGSSAQSPSPDPTRINQKLLMTVEDAQAIHAAKDAMGPALAGSASWKNFVGSIETRIKAASAVDAGELMVADLERVKPKAR